MDNAKRDVALLALKAAQSAFRRVRFSQAQVPDLHVVIVEAERDDCPWLVGDDLPPFLPVALKMKPHLAYRPRVPLHPTTIRLHYFGDEKMLPTFLDLSRGAVAAYREANPVVDEWASRIERKAEPEDWELIIDNMWPLLVREVISKAADSKLHMVQKTAGADTAVPANLTLFVFDICSSSASALGAEIQKLESDKADPIPEAACNGKTGPPPGGEAPNQSAASETPVNLTPRQEILLEAIDGLVRTGTGPWHGRKIAERAQLGPDSRARTDLSTMKKLGFLESSRAGYMRTEKPYQSP